MTGHTPGPWAIANGCDVFTPLGATNASGERAADNDGWHIADCLFDIPYEECCANARLIAAAPELLEALQAMLRAVEESNPLASVMLTSRACELAKDAIARAGAA